MLNSSVLDVAIGLVFVYLVLGLMCTMANEWIAQFFDLRAKTLKQGIERLLHHVPVDAASFCPAEINAIKLLGRLMSPGDKLAVAMGLDPAGSPSGITPASAELAPVRETLAKLLNEVLTDPHLYEKIDMRSATEATLKRVRKQLSGDNLRKANAALLREAYPEELGSLAIAFYNHPLIQSLCRAGKLPSYIPAQAFSAALTNILGAGGVDAVRLAIASLPESPGRRALTVLASKSGMELADFERGLEVWFDQSMDRVSGWYKRTAQLVTVIVAAGITVWANADTVGIARNLYVTPVIRQRILQDASATAKPASELSSSQKADVGELTGWSSEFVTFHRLKSGNPQSPPDDSFPGLDLVTSGSLFGNWLWAIVPGHLLGWILTTVAVSLGAPFWFDTLNKFMNIRAAGTAPDEKGQDKSKS